MKINKLLLALLGLSVAINLAVVGFLAGQSMKPAMLVQGADPMRLLPRWAHSLPTERQDALLPMLRQQRRGAILQLRDIRSAHAAVQAAVAAESFDVKQLAQKLASLREVLGVSQQTSHDDFIEFVAALSAPERQHLASQLGRPKGARRRPGGPEPSAWHQSRACVEDNERTHRPCPPAQDPGELAPQAQ